MLRRRFRLAALLALLSTPALAQTSPPDQQTPVPQTPAPALPEPPLNENSGPVAFLRAAAHALAAGRTGEAQQAMEMAQTRMLDRAVPLGATGTPSDQPVVTLISQALQALRSDDRETCLQKIQAARQALRQP